MAFSTAKCHFTQNIYYWGGNAKLFYLLLESTSLWTILHSPLGLYFTILHTYSWNWGTLSAGKARHRSSSLHALRYSCIQEGLLCAFSPLPRWAQLESNAAILCTWVLKTTRTNYYIQHISTLQSFIFRSWVKTWGTVKLQNTPFHFHFSIEINVFS